MACRPAQLQATGTSSGRSQTGQRRRSRFRSLAKALRDSDPLVRRDAVLAVAKLEKPSEAVIAQLKAMHQTDPDPLIRDYANRAIVHFGEAE